MEILVVDVAADSSGAVTILNQFISSFEEQQDNNYHVVLGKLHYENKTNITFLNYEWVKKSHVFRLFFDHFVVPKLVKKYKPDLLLSLQNNAFSVRKTKQVVYFHNALPISETKIRFSESRKMWFYQNVIGRIVKNSLKYADEIIVQGEWIKKRLSNKWRINESKISVLRPRSITITKKIEYQPEALFYPATGLIYKNHITLMHALQPLWNRDNAPKLRLTGAVNDLPKRCQNIIKQNNYPIEFLGKLSFDEMIDQYSKSILVFPSYIETVGLPLIEAKKVGCRMIVADCEYAHEAIGEYDGVDYFSALSAKELSSVIENNCKRYHMIN